ncbi:MAG: outer membrane beta-barrel protein [Deltaproteobacteria bacterium]|jgi:hypothetical protein|nr:outer membrane beta-barrel protein [Deltaproteobacteria bacterium]
MKYALTCIIVALCLSSAVQAAEPYGGKFNSFTFSIGGYWPHADLEGEGYKSGGNFAATYMRAFHDWFGFGCGTHTYVSQSKKKTADIGDGDFSAMGIEMMLFAQPNHWRIQPYIGLGPALYFNFIAYEDDTDHDDVEESGAGFGGVLKAGVRVFVTDRFFSGMSVKFFSNRWNLDIDENRDKTYDFGGGVLAFELGFTF